MRNPLFSRLLLVAAGLALLAPGASAIEVSTKDGGHAQNPVWSPDGQWIAFETNNNSNTVELYVAKVAGGVPSTPVQMKIPGATSSFGGGGGYVSGAVWATTPSLMLVFEGANPGGKMRLYYANPGSGAPNELITTAQLSDNLSAPAISPNGKRFAFISDKTGNGDVYVWDIASGQIKVTFMTEQSENFPAFNPTGETVVFSRKHEGNQDLFTWNGANATPPLKGGAGDQTRPRYAGDKVVYFTSERGDGHWDIAVVDAVGKRAVVAQDVRLPARAAPAVTPDGQAVAYTASDPEKGDRIYVSRLDGSSTVEIPTGLVACGEPAIVTANGRTWLAFTALPAEGSDWRRLHVLDVTGKI